MNTSGNLYANARLNMADIRNQLTSSGGVSSSIGLVDHKNYLRTQANGFINMRQTESSVGVN